MPLPLSLSSQGYSIFALLPFSVSHNTTGVRREPNVGHRRPRSVHLPRRAVAPYTSPVGQAPTPVAPFCAAGQLQCQRSCSSSRSLSSAACSSFTLPSRPATIGPAVSAALSARRWGRDEARGGEGGGSSISDVPLGWTGGAKGSRGMLGKARSVGRGGRRRREKGENVVTVRRERWRQGENGYRRSKDRSRNLRRK